MRGAKLHRSWLSRLAPKQSLPLYGADDRATSPAVATSSAALVIITGAGFPPHSPRTLYFQIGSTFITLRLVLIRFWLPTRAVDPLIAVCACVGLAQDVCPVSLLLVSWAFTRRVFSFTAQAARPSNRGIALSQTASRTSPFAPSYALKELPHPQVDFTFGLLNLKPEPSNEST